MKEEGEAAVSPALAAEGVGLVLYNDQGKILIVFEGNERIEYDKGVGDPSIAWETRDRSPDGSFESIDRALQRVLDEEVGLDVKISKVSLLLQFTTSFGIPQTIFCAEFHGASRMGGTAIDSGEILGWEWIFPEDLIGRRMRGGMREILAAYQRFVCEEDVVAFSHEREKRVA